MITTGCILEAHHRIADMGDIGDLNTPADVQKLKEWADLHDRAHLVTFTLTQEQAQRIRARLWPRESLLGATCGKGFFIETIEQVAAINDILQPDIRIQFSPDHQWMLQTWPIA